jgi:hypothetical protein
LLSPGLLGNKSFGTAGKGPFWKAVMYKGI